MSFFDRISRKLTHSKKAGYFEESGIRFFHHNPPRGNLGDYLCSPRHYFEFVASESPLNIIGGGVYVDMGVRFVKKNDIAPDRTILWGVGESIRTHKSIEKITELPFLEWGCRDRDRVSDDSHFVPCCSCFHKMLDSPVRSDGVLLFLNADPKVSGESGRSELQEFSKCRGWNLLYNNCDESEFVKALDESRYIVTNSYHGAYWGLLSGRTVCLVGYSSKFYSLLFGFGLSGSRVFEYERGNAHALLNLLDNIEVSGSGIALDDADALRLLYRNINMGFLERLVERKIIESYRAKPRSSLFVK